MTQKPTYKELEKKLKVLQESEKRYRKVLQTAIDGFLLHDSDGRIMDVNDAYCRMTGYDKQELLNMRVSDLQASASPEEVLLTIENIIDQGADRFKTRQRRKDGNILDVEVSVQFHPEEKGRLFAFFRDVTEQKRAEEKIRILSSAVEQSIDGIAIANDVKGFTYVNEAFAGMHGYTPEEMIGMNIGDVSDPEFPDQVPEIIERLSIDGSYRGETSRIRKDGTSFTVLQSSTAMRFSGSKVRWAVTICRDITERKQTEIEREKLQALLSTAVEITNLAPWEYDVANDLFTLNDIFYKIFRTTAEEVGGYTMSSEEFDRRFVHPEENLGPLRESIDEIEKILDSNTPSYHRTIYSDGTVGYTSVKMLVIRDSQGNAVRAYGVNQDITERMKAEEEREKMQFLLSNALGLANLAPWEYDVTRDLFTFNDHFYKVFRTTVEEVGGYTMSSEEFAQRFFHPDELRTFKERLRESGKAIDPDSGPFEHRIIFGDGTVGYISVKMFVVKDSLGRTIRTYGASQDITEQKRMEEELLRTQKLESVGLLAGGIAHDFNNILTTILGNTYMAKMEVDPEDEVFELLSDMEIASSRAKALTKQLLTFAKGGTPVKKTSSIKEVIIKSSIFVLRGSRSSCEFSIAEDLWPVDVDVGLINRVIHNIVLNANQAMPNGGRIRVIGENLTVEEKHSLPVKPGRYVRISIMDHGGGIAKEDIAKVFDPFFSTKAEGSGLGLATAYSIVKKHDGHISVESELGKSTTFQIYLSASEKKVSEKENNWERLKG